MPFEERAPRAVIFDTDGVITRTAALHAATWATTFDAFLAGAPDGPGDRSPFSEQDYRRYVDGRPRAEGVATFLAARGIELPEGTRADPAGRGSIWALANDKEERYVAALRRDGVTTFPSTVRAVRALRELGIATAAISASEHCGEVLRAAGVADLFDVRVDGVDAHRLGLPGRPDPAILLEAIRRLGVEPTDTALIEDAAAGVEAGRRAGLGLVVGVDRTGDRDALAAFADLVVVDLVDLEITADGIQRCTHPLAPLPELTSALDDPDVARRLDDRRPAVFLDYDGTLTPIVARPELAVLDPATLAVLERLAAHCVVGIISGRDLDDVRAMVAAEGLWFAGSHGFDILAPDGTHQDLEAGRDVLPALDRAVELLEGLVPAIPEAWIERKRFAIAVHHRQTPEDRVPELAAAVAAVADEVDGLRMVGGKMIFELRPDLDWDKGKALRWVIEASGTDRPGILPVYVGDDVTDEDAYLAIRDRGLAIVVGDEDRETSAHHRLADPDEVRTFLDRLAGALEREAAR